MTFSEADIDSLTGLSASGFSRLADSDIQTMSDKELRDMVINNQLLFKRFKLKFKELKK